MYNSPKESIQIDQNDLNSFNTIVWIFLLTKIFAFVLDFFKSLALVEAIVSDGGTVILAIGIISLARKNPKLTSGLRVGILFVISVILSFASSLFNYLYPTPTISTGTPQEVFTSLYNALSPRLIYLVTVSLLSGILILITAYYFTKWFNLAFGEYKPTKIYWYYGILSFIGALFASIGEYMLVQAIPQMNLTSGTLTTQSFTPQFYMSLASTGLGGILLLVAFVLLIVASVKIHNRVNEKAQGITPFNQPGAYQNPYQQPYQPNYQQPPQMNSNQYGIINPNKLDQPAYNQAPANNTTPVNSSEKNFCNYCGAQIQPGIKFCQNCGNKL